MPKITLKSWFTDIYDGSPVGRYIDVLAAIEARPNREMSVVQLAERFDPAHDAAFVDRLVNAAKQSLQPGPVAPPDDPETGELLEFANIDHTLQCAEDRDAYLAARDRFAKLLEAAADAADRRRSPKRTPPPRGRMGQMLRYRAEQVRHPRELPAVDDPEPTRQPGASGHYDVAAQYPRMKRWLSAQKQLHPDSWTTDDDDSRRRARSYCILEIAKHKALHEADLQHEMASAAYDACCRGESHE